MTGSRTTADESSAGTATVRTEHDEARIVASSVRPDNTPEIDTRVEDGDSSEAVVTEIRRETTGGLRTTVDDYVVNLAVAQDVVQAAKRHAEQQIDDNEPTQNS